MSPAGIQLSRAKGWRKPAGAVVVARPSKWGNPFKVGEKIESDGPLWPYAMRSDPWATSLDQEWARSGGLLELKSVAPTRVEDVVAWYGWWFIEQPALMLTVEAELGGRDLACWCKVGAACHRDFLLSIANGGGNNE